MNKRKIIQFIIVSFFSFSCVKTPISGSNENLLNTDSLNSYPFQTLKDAFRTIGFDPSEKGNSFFVTTADVHYGGPGNGMLTTLSEVNKMDPNPAFFCVNGDLIVNGSLSFGRVPTFDQRQIAISEFKAFKKDIELLNKQIGLILALGNHDTHPKEVDPEIFWEVFPGYPPYQSLSLSGVHIIVLNGHSTGYIDEKQMEWLLNDVKEISKDQTVIIIIHQPSMSHRTRERGIPEAITQVFEEHQGLVWLIGGHEHRNSEKIFQLRNTKLVQHGITCGAANIWGGPERPGYWIYCLQDGDVVGRIYRKLETGYRIETEPEFENAVKVPMAFDHLENITWKALAGTIEDQKNIIYIKGNDCNNWWSYVRELEYCFPLKETGNNCSKFTMLCDYKAMEKLVYRGDQYYLSNDQKNWTEIKLENAEFETLSFVIPQNLLQSEFLYFKFISAGEIHVGGFALLR